MFRFQSSSLKESLFHNNTESSFKRGKIFDLTIFVSHIKGQKNGSMTSLCTYILSAFLSNVNSSVNTLRCKCERLSRSLFHAICAASPGPYLNTLIVCVCQLHCEQL